MDEGRLAGDEPVDDGEVLLRWIPDSQLVPGEFKVQSEMFRKVSFSVDRAAIKSLAAFKAEHRGKHVAKVLASHCRTVGYDASPDPLPENRAHALVHTAATGNDLRRMARRLRDEFVELIPNSI